MSLFSRAAAWAGNIALAAAGRVIPQLGAMADPPGVNIVGVPGGLPGFGGLDPLGLGPDGANGQANPLWLPDSTLAYMRMDPTIALAFALTKAPFYGVEYWIDCRSREIREFCEETFVKRIHAFLGTALLSFDWGRQPAELVWALDNVETEWLEEAGEDGGDPRTERRSYPNAYVIEEFAALDPFMTSILYEPRIRGAIPGFAGVQTAGAQDRIPAEKLVLALNESEYRNLYGRAQSLRAYRDWRNKLRVMLDLLRYLEQKGNPPLIGQAPDEPVVDPRSGKKIHPMDIMLAAMSNLRGGGWFVLPRRFHPLANQVEYALDTLKVADRADEFLQAYDRLDAKCFVAMFVPPALAGIGDGKGTFAQGKVVQQLFFGSLDDRKQNTVIRPANEQALPRMVRANFSGVGSRDMPKLCCGDLSENRKEILATVLERGLDQATKTKSGRVVPVGSLFNYPKILSELGMPIAEDALIPSVEEVAPLRGGGPPGGGQAAGGRPGPGRPPRIVPEPDRPNAPSRPGLSARARGRAREVIELAAPAPTAKEWLDAAIAGLGRVDDVIAKTEKLVEAERASVSAEIRNLVKKAIARAKTKGGRLSAANRTLAADVGRDVEALLEASMFEDLLDEADIDARALGLASSDPLFRQIEEQMKAQTGNDLERAAKEYERVRSSGAAPAPTPSPAQAAPITTPARAAGRRKMSPLAMQHAAAFRAATDTLAATGFSQPGKSAGLRIVKDVVRDGKSNGRGVVTRETRGVTEPLDRMIMDEVAVEQADAWADQLELVSNRDFDASTIAHVRATARKTLAWPDDEAEEWLILAGPDSEAEALKSWPNGKVAEQLWATKTTDELDRMFHELTVGQGRPMTSWKGLGLNFNSKEMYVPVPKGPLGEEVKRLAGEERAAFNGKRERSQAAIDRARARDAAKGRDPVAPPVAPPRPPPPPPPEAPPAGGDVPEFDRAKARFDAKRLVDWPLTKDKDKATKFREVLGFGPENADLLAEQIRQGVTNPAFAIEHRGPTEKDGKFYGHQYRIIMDVAGANGRVAKIVTGWFIDVGTDIARFMTAWVHASKKQQQ